MAEHPTRTVKQMEDNIFFIEAITGERLSHKGYPRFCVKYEGYPAEESTWEPRRNVSAVSVAQWRAQQAQLDELESDDDENMDDREPAVEAAGNNAVDMDYDNGAADEQESESELSLSGDEDMDDGGPPAEEAEEDLGNVSETQSNTVTPEELGHIVGEYEGNPKEYRVHGNPNANHGSRHEVGWYPEAAVDNCLIVRWKALKSEFLDAEPTDLFNFEFSQRHTFVERSLERYALVERRMPTVTATANEVEEQPSDVDADAEWESVSDEADVIMSDEIEHVSLSSNTPSGEQSNDEEADIESPPPTVEQGLRCNDPAFKNTEGAKHGIENHVCDGDLHRGQVIATCNICSDKAVSLLNEEEQYIHQHGAKFPLCSIYAGPDIDSDFASSVWCICLKSRCCSCLRETITRLIEAKMTIGDERAAGERCFDCLRELCGGEFLFRCALCNGVHLPTDV